MKSHFFSAFYGPERYLWAGVIPLGGLIGRRKYHEPESTESESEPTGRAAETGSAAGRWPEARSAEPATWSGRPATWSGRPAARSGRPARWPGRTAGQAERQSLISVVAFKVLLRRTPLVERGLFLRLRRKRSRYPGCSNMR